MHKIIEWQHESGCFGELNDKIFNRSICQNHMTGLGIGVLALFNKISYLGY